MTQLVAPFPWFGGKRTIASDVWKNFGEVRNYVEPFFGSGAVLLSRDNACDVETVNDADGLLVNFWRAVRCEPEAVAVAADWPVSETDLMARHIWLIGQRESLTARLEADPDWYDVKIAGWWLWGIAGALAVTGSDSKPLGGVALVLFGAGVILLGWRAQQISRRG